MAYDDWDEDTPFEYSLYGSSEDMEPVVIYEAPPGAIERFKASLPSEKEMEFASHPSLAKLMNFS